MTENEAFQLFLDNQNRVIRFSFRPTRTGTWIATYGNGNLESGYVTADGIRSTVSEIRHEIVSHFPELG
jgi:hypothetical protein